MCILLSLSGSGSDAASLITKAEYDSRTDEYVINGTKVFISGAGKLCIMLFLCTFMYHPSQTYHYYALWYTVLCIMQYIL